MPFGVKNPIIIFQYYLKANYLVQTGIVVSLMMKKTGFGVPHGKELVLINLTETKENLQANILLLPMFPDIPKA